MNIVTLSAALLVLIGFISLILGLIVLTKKALSKDIEEVTEEAAKLAKKGLLTDVGNSLQSASFLVKEMTELIKTARGIGLTLIIIGIVLLAGGLALYKSIIL
ncbi:MAG: hypothetical protein IKP86_00400 [Anaerolineaceae bacterium]|nr:hypothetical protein [Anaerolineaceae bacterium]